MATFEKITIKDCGDNIFSKQMNFTCQTCGHEWVASNGAGCPKCNGQHIVIESQGITKNCDSPQCRITELEEICAEAYQVVGVLAYKGGVFNTLPVIKILDNLSASQMIHKDILPFTLDEDILTGLKQNKLRELVDLVWNTATESTEVPSTKWADELITKVFGVYKNDN